MTIKLLVIHQQMTHLAIIGWLITRIGQKWILEKVNTY